MLRRRFLQRLANTGLLATTGAWASSCGTILHPERVGQPAGRIDPGIAILDGLGLLLFLVPGVVAFIVDFATGAIYLPPEYVGMNERKNVDASGLVRVPIERDRMSRRRIEQTVARASGVPISLEPGSYQAEPLDSLSGYRAAAETLALRHDRPAREVIFRCQSE